MNSQTTLTDHGIPVDRRPIKSATSNRIYYVVVGEDHLPHCTDGNGGPGCKHSQIHDTRNPCRHVWDFKNQKAEELITYLRTRYERPSNAWFRSFDHVLAHYRWKPDMEYNIMRALFLSIGANQKTLSADDIHEVVQERFVGDPRKIGAVQLAMVTCKPPELEVVGRIRSVREKCHHRKIDLLRITPAGLDLLKGMT